MRRASAHPADPAATGRRNFVRITRSREDRTHALDRHGREKRAQIDANHDLVADVRSREAGNRMSAAKAVRGGVRRYRCDDVIQDIPLHRSQPALRRFEQALAATALREPRIAVMPHSRISRAARIVAAIRERHERGDPNAEPARELLARRECRHAPRRLTHLGHPRIAHEWVFRDRGVKCRLLDEPFGHCVDRRLDRALLVIVVGNECDLDSSRKSIDPRSLARKHVAHARRHLPPVERAVEERGC